MSLREQLELSIDIGAENRERDLSVYDPCHLRNVIFNYGTFVFRDFNLKKS